jgi:hypothetical protein
VTNDNELYGNPFEGEVVFRLRNMNSGSKVLKGVVLVQKLKLLHVRDFKPETLISLLGSSGVTSCPSVD